MDLTRREFLGYSAGAIGLVALPTAEPTDWRKSRWFAVPPEGEGLLPESLSGYCNALPGSYGLNGCRLLVFPVALNIPRQTIPLVRQVLRGGGTVLIESGAGLDPLKFRRHRRTMRQLFQIDVSAPLDRWAGSAPRTPYIDYTWPYATKIRDFTRVVPVAEKQDSIIAWADDVPVALRRAVEGGTLIYLGSPLGPVLRAGDVEARRWLHAVALAA